MRLFIAVNFSKEVKQQILEVQDRIKDVVKQGKFSSPENLHLTLVFLGETPAERLPEIKNAMNQVAFSDRKPASAFYLAFSNAGFFKRGGKELWWLGIDEKNCNEEKQLKALQSSLAAELTSRGFHIDRRPFTAHITLGREIKNGPWPFKTEKIPVNVKRISLMLSEHMRNPDKKNKLIYTELFGCDL